MDNTNILFSLQNQIKEVEKNISTIEIQIEQCQNVLTNTQINFINNELAYAEYDKEELNYRIVSLTNNIDTLKQHLQKFRAIKMELEKRFVVYEKYIKEYNVEIPNEEIEKQKLIENCHAEYENTLDDCVFENIEIKQKKEKLKEIENQIQTATKLNKIKLLKKTKSLNKEIEKLTKQFHDNCIKVDEIYLKIIANNLDQIEYTCEFGYNLTGTISKSLFGVETLFNDEENNETSQDNSVKNEDIDYLFNNYFSIVESFPDYDFFKRSENDTMMMNQKLNNIKLDKIKKFNLFLKAKKDELTKSEELNEKENVKIKYLNDTIELFDKNIVLLDKKLNLIDSIN